MNLPTSNKQRSTRQNALRNEIVTSFKMAPKGWTMERKNTGQLSLACTGNLRDNRQPRRLGSVLPSSNATINQHCNYSLTLYPFSHLPSTLVHDTIMWTGRAHWQSHYIALFHFPNPLNPIINVQIPKTVLCTLPERIGWENLITDLNIFPLVIILDQFRFMGNCPPTPPLS